MALPIVTRMYNVNYKRKVIVAYLRRYCQVVNNNVRVRFAPSPTGMLHLGGLRTALFNYLFAKSNRGTFILRIEDTDLTRLVPGAVENLNEMLNWAGLYPDESPFCGGLYGPYTQSERLDLYRENINKLLQSGHCYRCFCTVKRLDLLRKEAVRRQEVPGYDNKCRHMTQQEIDEKLSHNIPYVIRFKYEPILSPWLDLVYGVMHQKAVGESLEGDFIVLKTDSFPTYHFANVVDDHYMKITHVLRGVEWNISTPKHLQLYAAFGWQPPLYAHLPLILNSDGTKLSKRQGDIRVESFKDQNFDVNALLNYLTTINGGFTENTEGKTLEEMVPLFSLDKVTSHSCRLQPEKLNHLSRVHLQRKYYGQQRQQVIDDVKTMIKNHYGDRLLSDHVLQDKFIEQILSWAMEYRISQLTEILDKVYDFIWIVPNTTKLKEHFSKDKRCQTILQDSIEKIKVVEPFTSHTVKDVLLCYCKDAHVEVKYYMSVLRRSFSDSEKGPAVSEMMGILGKDESLKRLQCALDVLTQKEQFLDGRSMVST